MSVASGGSNIRERVAHFFVSVCGSKIRWRVAQNFIDIHNQIARYLNEGGQMNETLSQEIRKTLTTLDLSIHDFNSAVEAEYGQSS